MMTVLHTSASDLETGLITLEIVTAIGTDMPIDNNKPITYIRRAEFLEIWSMKTGKLSM